MRGSRIFNHMVELRDDARADLDRTFSALADPTRRAILARLRGGTATVGEIAEPFEMSLHGVSKHVRILERAGLVGRRIRGRSHHLHLVATPLAAAAEFTDHYRAFWEARLDALADHLEKPGRPSLDARRTETPE